jgi:cystathionine beta-lyase
MAYDFEQAVNRRNTNSTRWDNIPVNPNAIPMWVADMDFLCPPEVAQAIRQRLDHEIFGYTPEPKEFRQAVSNWQKTRHNWDIGDAHVMGVTSVVPAMFCAVRAYTQPGDKVLVQRPVYGPFTRSIVEQGREAISSGLVQTADGWEIDFEDLAEKLSDPAVKMMFLCNPHNPVGRVYTRQELEKIYELCQKHNVVIFADEIHSDFVYAGHTHVSMGALHTKGVITAIAPSKTFNLASLKTAVMICADEELWGPFKKDGELTGLGNVNIFGHIATVAAYTHGAAYVDAMMQHLTENVEILCRELETIPQINMMKPEGTYLMWLDCRALGLKNDELVAFFANEAGVSMNGGTFFGPEGDGFVRMNIACPHATVCQAMKQIRSAVEKRALATV